MRLGGRTKGVSACGQVISFYSWYDVPPEAVAQALSSARPGALRALHVQRMPRSFHATYSVGCPHLAHNLARIDNLGTKQSHAWKVLWALTGVIPCKQAAWRRYIYLFPLLSSADSSAAGTSPAAENYCSSCSCSDVICVSAVDRLPAASLCCMHDCAFLSHMFSKHAFRGPIPSPRRLNRLLKALEGRTVDFYAYARDPPKGKATECIIYSASARSVQVPGCSGAL